MLQTSRSPLGWKNGNLACGQFVDNHTVRHFRASKTATDITSSQDYRRNVMKFEKNRLNTFDSWPKRDIINTKEMAASGLYYVGTDDKVKCAFCDGTLMNWVAEDKPRDEHLRYYGTKCAFIRGEPSDNVPLKENSHSAGSRDDMYLTRTGDISRLLPQTRSPALKEESERLKTFQYWPNTAQANPAELARAGFYYTGTGDHVRCFSCNGRLGRWESADVPLEVHGHWYPQCSFVKEKKDAISSESVPEISERAGNPTRRTGNGNQQRTTAGVKGEFDHRLVAAQLATRQVQIVLNMGFPRPLVKKTIEARIRETGQGFPSAEILAEVMLEGPNATPVNTLQAPCDQVQDNIGRSQPTPSHTVVTSGDGEETTSTPFDTRSLQGPRALEEENRRLKEERLCKVCMDRQCCILFLQCRHLVVCQECVSRLKECPVCRSIIRGSVRTFIS